MRILIICGERFNPVKFNNIWCAALVNFTTSYKVHFSKPRKNMSSNPKVVPRYTRRVFVIFKHFRRQIYGYTGDYPIEYIKENICTLLTLLNLNFYFDSNVIRTLINKIFYHRKVSKQCCHQLPFDTIKFFLWKNRTYYSLLKDFSIVHRSKIVTQILKLNVFYCWQIN